MNPASPPTDPPQPIDCPSGHASCTVGPSKWALAEIVFDEPDATNGAPVLSALTLEKLPDVIDLSGSYTQAAGKITVNIDLSAYTQGNWVLKAEANDGDGFPVPKNLMTYQYDSQLPVTPVINNALYDQTWTGVNTPQQIDFPDSTDNRGIACYDIYYGTLNDASFAAQDPDTVATVQCQADSDYLPAPLGVTGQYFFRARAKDVSGNYSPWSNSTFYQFDQSPPSVPTIGTLQVFDWTNQIDNTPVDFDDATDTGGGIKRYNLCLTLNSGVIPGNYACDESHGSPSQADVLSNENTSQYIFSFLPSSGEYRLFARSVDNADNLSAWAHVATYRYDNEPPTVPATIFPTAMDYYDTADPAFPAGTINCGGALNTGPVDVIYFDRHIKDAIEGPPNAPDSEIPGITDANLAACITEATDGHSGVNPDRFEIYWGTSPNGQGSGSPPAGTFSGDGWQPGTSQAFATGAFNPDIFSQSQELYLRARTSDNAGNYSNWVTIAAYGYDADKPEPATALGRNYDWTRNNDPAADFNLELPGKFDFGANDIGESDLGQFEFYWGRDPGGSDTNYRLINNGGSPTGNGVGQYITQTHKVTTVNQEPRKVFDPRYPEANYYAPDTRSSTDEYPVDVDGDGLYYLRVRSIDHALNLQETWVTVATYKYDRTKPDLTPDGSSLSDIEWTNNATPGTFDFPDVPRDDETAGNEFGSDRYSGINQSGYDIYFGEKIDYVEGDTVGTHDTLLTGQTSVIDINALNLTSKPSNTYYLRARVTDNAGNKSDYSHLRYYKFDKDAPDFSGGELTHVFRDGAWQPVTSAGYDHRPGSYDAGIFNVNDPPNFRFSRATDGNQAQYNGGAGNFSGLASYDVYIGTASAASNPSATGSIPVSVPDNPPATEEYNFADLNGTAVGKYNFLVRARDVAGNVTAWKHIASYYYDPDPKTLKDLRREPDLTASAQYYKEGEEIDLVVEFEGTTAFNNVFDDPGDPPNLPHININTACTGGTCLPYLRMNTGIDANTNGVIEAGEENSGYKVLYDSSADSSTDSIVPFKYTVPAHHNVSCLDTMSGQGEFVFFIELNGGAGPSPNSGATTTMTDRAGNATAMSPIPTSLDLTNGGANCIVIDTINPVIEDIGGFKAQIVSTYGPDNKLAGPDHSVTVTLKASDVNLDKVDGQPASNSHADSKVEVVFTGPASEPTVEAVYDSGTDTWSASYPLNGASFPEGAVRFKLRVTDKARNVTGDATEYCTGGDSDLTDAQVENDCVDFSGIPPQMTSAVTRDLDGNGRIDRLEVSFNEKVDITDVSAVDGFPSLTLSNGYTIANKIYSIETGKTLLLLDLNEKASPDTGASFTVTYNESAAGDIKDELTYEMQDAHSIGTTDGAKPVLISLSSNGVGPGGADATLNDADTDSEGTGVVTITAVFSEDIDVSTNASEVTGLTQGYNLSNGSFNNTTDTWTSTFVLKDDNETATATFEIKGFQDLAAAPNTMNDDTDESVEVDTDKAVITSIVHDGQASGATNDILYDQDTITPVTVTVEFDQPMYTSAGVVTLEGLTSSPYTLPNTPANWTNSDQTYSATFTLTDDEETRLVAGTGAGNLKVAGFQDSGRNPAVFPAPNENTSHVVEVDTDTPAVANNGIVYTAFTTTNNNTVNEADVGQPITVEVTFDEVMNTSVAGSITIDGPGTDYTVTGLVWSNGDQTVTGTTSGNFLDENHQTNYQIRVENFQDLRKNVIPVTNEPLPVDTRSATATVTYTDQDTDNILEDPDTIPATPGNPTTVTVVFNEAMDTATVGSVEIEGLVGSPITVDPIIPDPWEGTTNTWKGTFQLDDNNEDVTENFKVSGFKDAVGNTIDDDTDDTIRVDTKDITKPSVTAFEIRGDDGDTNVESFLNDDDLASIELIIAFDEPMNTSVNGIVTVNGLTTDPYTTSGGTWDDNQTFRTTFTMNDDNEEATATFTISGFNDAVDNTMNPDSTNTIPVDTRNPGIVSIVFNAPSRTITMDKAVNAGVSDFFLTDSQADNTTNVTITFDQPMDTSAPVTAAINAQITGLARGYTIAPIVGDPWEGTNNTWKGTFTFRDDQEDSNDESNPLLGTVQLTGFLDPSGNTTSQYPNGTDPDTDHKVKVDTRMHLTDIRFYSSNGYDDNDPSFYAKENDTIYLYFRNDTATRNEDFIINQAQILSKNLLPSVTCEDDDANPRVGAFDDTCPATPFTTGNDGIWYRIEYQFVSPTDDVFNGSTVANQGLQVRDRHGNIADFLTPTDSSSVRYDITTPGIVSTFTTDNDYEAFTNPNLVAREGNTVEVLFSFNENIRSLTGLQIAGQAVSLQCDFDGDSTFAACPAIPAAGVPNYPDNRPVYRASYTMTSSEAEGSVPYQLTVEDMSGNQTVINSTATSDGESVTYDKTAPFIVTGPTFDAVEGSNTGGDPVTGFVSVGNEIRIDFLASERIRTSSSHPFPAILKYNGNTVAYGDVTGGFGVPNVDVPPKYNYNLTYELPAAFGPDQATITYELTFYDWAGNNFTTPVTISGNTGILFDKTPPALSVLTVESNNNDNKKARPTNLITVDLDYTELNGIKQLRNPSIANAVATVVCDANGTLDGTYTAAECDFPIAGGDTDKLRIVYTLSGSEGLTSGAAIPFSFELIDYAGNVSTFTNADITSGGDVIYDDVAPDLTAVTITSPTDLGSGVYRAIAGDLITLTFTATEPLALAGPNALTVTIAGQLADNINSTGAPTYVATYTMQAGDTDGEVTFNISYYDEFGNEGYDQTGTTTPGDWVNVQPGPPTEYGTTNNSRVLFDKEVVLSSATIDSNNEYNSAYPTLIGNAQEKIAFNGNTVTLNLTFAEVVTLNSATIAGEAPSTSTGSGTNALAFTRVLTGADSGLVSNNLVPYSIEVQDTAGNTRTITTSTDSSQVRYDQSAPVISNLSIVSTTNNNSNPALAKQGSNVRISFTSNELIRIISHFTPDTSHPDFGNFPALTVAEDGGGANPLNPDSLVFVNGSYNYSFIYEMQADDLETSRIPFTMTIKDLAGNSISPLDQDDAFAQTATEVSYDKQVNITSVSIESSNARLNAAGNPNRMAKIGDTVAVTIQPGEQLSQSPTFIIGGNTVAAGNITCGGSACSFPTSSAIRAEYTLVSPADDALSQGAIAFQINDIQDLVGNSPASPPIATTDGTEVVFDNVDPSAGAGVRIAAPAPVLSQAKAGDNIVVTITSPERLFVSSIDLDITATSSPSGTIVDTSAAHPFAGPYTYTATFAMDSGDDEGIIPADPITSGLTIIPMTVNFEDLVGNSTVVNGTTKTNTTDASYVIYDKSPPALTTQVAISTNSSASPFANANDDIILTFKSDELLEHANFKVTVDDSNTSDPGEVAVLTVNYNASDEYVLSFKMPTGIQNGVLSDAGAISMQLEYTDLAGNAGAILNTDSSGDFSGSVTYDETDPQVVSVSSTPNTVTYGLGGDIAIDVLFDDIITVTGGTPTITLNNGAVATFRTGSDGDNTLTFDYTVAATESVDPLNTGTSLDLQGATLRDQALNDGVLTLPTTGPNALSASTITIDTDVPVITDVDSTLAQFPTVHSSPTVVDIIVTYDKPVAVTGTPSIQLNTTPVKSATFQSIDGTNRILTFSYTIENNVVASPLNTAADIALNSGTIRQLGLQGASINNASLTINHGGTTLGGKDIRIDSLPGSVDYVTSTDDDTPVKGIGDTVDIDVYFTEIVNVTVAAGIDKEPRFDLNIAGTPQAIYIGGTGTNMLTFRYTVGVGDETSALNQATGAPSIQIPAGSSITDAGGNNILTALPTAAAQQLTNTKTFIIDGIVPDINNIQISSNNALDSALAKAGDTINITFREVGDDDLLNLNQFTVDLNGVSKSSSGPDITASYNSGTNVYTLSFVLSSAFPAVTDGDLPGDISIQLDYRDLGGNAGGSKFGGNFVPGSKVTYDLTQPQVSIIESTVNSEKHGLASEIPITVTFDEPVIISGSPEIPLNSGNTAVYDSANNTDVINFKYTVGAGDAAAPLNYTASAVDLAGGSVTDLAGNNLTLTLTGSTTLSDNNIIIDTDLPSIVSITSSASDSTVYGFNPPDNEIEFTITYDENVTVNLDVAPANQPRFLINTTPTQREAEYVSGSGTNQLLFRYTVQNNDEQADISQAGDITFSGTSSITQSDILPANGVNNAELDLFSGSVAALSDVRDITVDAKPASITGISSTNLDQPYGIGSEMVIDVVFDEPVTVSGTPELALNIPGNPVALYDAGSSPDTSTMRFKYTVVEGDVATDFGNQNTSALSLAGGSIKDAGDNDALLTLPALLQTSRSIVVDGVRPVLSAFSIESNNGFDIDWANDNDQVLIRFTSDEPLNLTPNHDFIVTLNQNATSFVLNHSNGLAVADAGLNYTLSFTMPGAFVNGTIPGVAGSGDISVDIDYRDLAGNTGLTRDNTAFGGDTVEYDETHPVVVSATAPVSTLDGTYGEGAVIPIEVTFDDIVIVSGNPRFDLNPAGTQYAEYATGSGSTVLTFNYTVGAGDNIGDLDYNAALDIDLNSGALHDRAANDVDRDLPAPTGSISLGDQRNLVIDTVAPVVTSIDAPGMNGIHTNPANIDITVTYDKAVAIASGTPGFTVNTTPTNRTAAYLSGAPGTVLTFRYTVQAGDQSPDLTNVSDITGGVITQNGLQSGTNNASLTLPVTPNTLGEKHNIVIDAAAPSITSITSADDGRQGIGATINIDVNLSEIVTVNTIPGTPTLVLNTTPSRVATFSTGSGTSTLRFTYQVQEGDESSDLGHDTATPNLQLNGGIILDVGLNALDLSIPNANPDRLIDDGDIIVDGVRPVLSAFSIESNNSFDINWANDNDQVLIRFTSSEALNLTPNHDFVVTLNQNATNFVLNHSNGLAVADAGLNYTLSFTMPGAFVNGTIPGVAGSGDISVDIDYRDLAGNAGLTRDNTAFGGDKVDYDETHPVVVSATAPGATLDGTYGEGALIPIEVTFDDIVIVSGNPRFDLNPVGTQYAEYASGSGSNVLTFNYTVGAGDNVADLDYNDALDIDLNSGALHDRAANDANRDLPAPTGSISLGDQRNLAIDTVAPVITSIDAPGMNGIHTDPANIDITVTYDKAVAIASGTPGFTVNTTPTNRTAAYLSGAPGTVLTFRYTVQPGDQSADLTNTSDITGGVIIQNGLQAGANNASLALPASPATLGEKQAIVIDANPGVINSITSSAVDGTYGTGANIDIDVTFSENMTLTNSGGDPYLNLNTTPVRTAVYTGGSGTGTWTFRYTVNTDDEATNLDTTALVIPGTSTIQDIGLNDLDTTMPSVAPNRFTDTTNIDIDGTRPTVTNVVSTDGNYGLGAPIDITVTFSEPVDVDTSGGNPTFSFQSGGSAVYQGGAGTSHTFRYVVQTGQNTSNLGYAVAAAIASPGSSKIYQSGLVAAVGGENLLIPTLPADGAAADSLRDNNTIVIDTVLPTITNIVATPDADTNGTYGIGSTLQIDVQFSKSVTVQTPAPTITLSNGAIATYQAGSPGTTLRFDYSVAGGDTNATDLSNGATIDYSGAAKIFQSGLTAGENLINPALPADGAPNDSLADNQDVNINTDIPQITDITAYVSGSPVGPGTVTYASGQAIDLHVTFDLGVDETDNGTDLPNFGVDSGGTATYTSGSPSNILVFRYSVAGGEDSADLDDDDAAITKPAGSNIVKSGIDFGENVANLDLTGVSLASDHAIIIDTTAPVFTLYDVDIREIQGPTTFVKDLGNSGTVNDSGGISLVEVSYDQNGGNFWNNPGFTNPAQTWYNATISGSGPFNFTHGSGIVCDSQDASIQVSFRATDGIGNQTTVVRNYQCDIAGPDTLAITQPVNGTVPNGTDPYTVNAPNFTLQGSVADSDVGMFLDDLDTNNHDVFLTLQRKDTNQYFNGTNWVAADPTYRVQAVTGDTFSAALVACDINETYQIDVTTVVRDRLDNQSNLPVKTITCNNSSLSAINLAGADWGAINVEGLPANETWPVPAGATTITGYEICVKTANTVPPNGAVYGQPCDGVSTLVDSNDYTVAGGLVTYNSTKEINFQALNTTQYVFIRGLFQGGGGLWGTSAQLLHDNKIPKSTIDSSTPGLFSNAPVIAGASESNADSSAGSDIASVEVSIQNVGSAQYFNGTDFTSATAVWQATTVTGSGSGPLNYSYSNGTLDSQMVQGEAYKVLVRTTDAAGNIDGGTVTNTFTFDNLGPGDDGAHTPDVLTITSLTNNAHYRVSTFDSNFIGGVCRDGLSGCDDVEIRVVNGSGDGFDGSAFVPSPAAWPTVNADGAGNYLYNGLTSSNLVDGAYTITVIGIDTVGNRSATGTQITINYDSTPPAIPTGLTTADVNIPDPQFTWDASASPATDNIDYYRVEYQTTPGGGNVTCDRSVENFQPSVCPPGDLFSQTGTYNVRVKAVDLAGNESDYSAAVSYDLEAATITSVTQTSATPGFSSGSVDYSWTVNAGGWTFDAATPYQVCFQSNGSCTTDPDNNINVTCTTQDTSTCTPGAFSGLTNGATYEFRVRILKAGTPVEQSAWSSVQSVVVNTNPPAQITPAPVTGFTQASIDYTNTDQPQYSFTANADADFDRYEICIDNASLAGLVGNNGPCPGTLENSTTQGTGTAAIQQAMTFAATGTYFTVVRAVSKGQLEGNWSPMEQVVYDNVAPTPVDTLTYPGDTNSANPLIGWQATDETVLRGTGGGMVCLKQASDATTPVGNGTAVSGCVLSWTVDLPVVASGTYSFNAPVPLAEDRYNVWVQSQDAAGNFSSWVTDTPTMTVDFQAPTGITQTTPIVPLSSVSNTLNLAGCYEHESSALPNLVSSASVEVSVRDSNGDWYDGTGTFGAAENWLPATSSSSVTCANQGEYTYNLTANNFNSALTYTLFIRGRDLAGNLETPLSITLSYDDLAPTVTLSPTIENQTVAAPSMIRGQFTDTGSGYKDLVVKLRATDGANAGNCLEPSGAGYVNCGTVSNFTIINVLSGSPLPAGSSLVLNWGFNSAGLAWEEGVTYQVEMTGVDQFDNSSVTTAVFTQSDQRPILDFTASSDDYTTGGVSPRSNEATNQVFTFRVRYTHAVAIAAVAQVWIDLDGNTLYSTNEKFDMTALSANPAVGIVYEYQTQLPIIKETDGLVRYRFYAHNGLHEAEDGPVDGDPVQTNELPLGIYNKDFDGEMQVRNNYQSRGQTDPVYILLKSSPQEAKVKVYSPLGKLVVELNYRDRGGLTWNLKDRNGQSVVSGTYIIVAETPKGIFTKKVMVVR